MDREQDRADELEALAAIYDQDFRLVEPPTETTFARFEVDLVDEFNPDVKVRIVFMHSQAYPEEPIGIVIHALNGVTSPKRKLLQQHLEEVARNNVETVSAFTVCEEARDWIAANVVGDADVEEHTGVFETLDATMEEKVEVISSKAVGTEVTQETFAEWRRKFEAEMEGKKTKEQLQKESNQKMTGRQMFESKVVVVSTESESFWEAEASQA